MRVRVRLAIMDFSKGKEARCKWLERGPAYSVHMVWDWIGVEDGRMKYWN